MVDTFQPRRLSCFRIRKRRRENRMNQEKTKTPKPSQHDMGWKAQRTFSLLPVAGEIFLLTLPFYRTALPPKFVLVATASQAGWSLFRVYIRIPQFALTGEEKAAILTGDDRPASRTAC